MLGWPLPGRLKCNLGRMLLLAQALPLSATLSLRAAHKLGANDQHICSVHVACSPVQIVTRWVSPYLTTDPDTMAVHSFTLSY